MKPRRQKSSNGHSTIGDEKETIVTHKRWLIWFIIIALLGLATSMETFADSTFLWRKYTFGSAGGRLQGASHALAATLGQPSASGELSSSHVHLRAGYWLAAPAASTATFVVNSAVDAVDAAPGNGVCATAGGVCTLRAAIQEANALPGADVISLPAGTYTLTLASAGEDAAATGDLDITGDITLQGAGAAATIIDADWADRVLHVTGAHRVNLSGVTLTHGNGGGGGIRSDGAALTIADSAISDNNSGGDAGGIFSSGSLTVTNSVFVENNARYKAGGILSSGALVVANSAFVENNAGGDGGGILSSGGLTIADSTFSRNNSGGDGGGVHSSSSATITNAGFVDNNTRTNGGAVYGAGVLIVASSVFTANNASSGGGIYDGGAAITVTHSAFAGNTAWTGGGVVTRQDVTIANSTFADNNADSGDHIYTDGGVLAVVNSTLFGRVEDPDRRGRAGDGPAGDNGGVHNAAAGGGSVTFANTLIAGHESGGNCVGAIANGGHNLEDAATCGWGNANGSLSNTAPLLGALTGSPAYFPLGAGSPAIDAGQNAVCAAAPVNNTAQNGGTRPVDGDGNGSAICDIGAFEAQSSGAPTLDLYLPLVLR